MLSLQCLRQRSLLRLYQLHLIQGLACHQGKLAFAAVLHLYGSHSSAWCLPVHGQCVLHCHLSRLGLVQTWRSGALTCLITPDPERLLHSEPQSITFLTRLWLCPVPEVANVAPRTG